MLRRWGAFRSTPTGNRNRQKTNHNSAGCMVTFLYSAISLCSPKLIGRAFQISDRRSMSMKRARFITLHLVLAIAIAGLVSSCSTSAKNQFFGQTAAPSENVFRYVTGAEPESLDPALPNGQPEARIFMALYDGLIEYHPVTLDPIPGIAESWEVAEGGTEYIFHLRKNAKFSNGDPISANDFVYSIRRGFSPELASRNASLGYYIKYSEAYNSGFAFVKGSDGKFLLKKDFVDMVEAASPQTATPAGDGAFHKFLDEPERLTIP